MEELNGLTSFEERRYKLKIAIFNAKEYDKKFLTDANISARHELTFFKPHLSFDTAVMAAGFEAVCVFVNDELNEKTIHKLAGLGVRLVILRCAGFNNVDLKACKEAGMTVARVPAYSPHGVAEHAVALILALNRKICLAYDRTRTGNFSLQGLLGFELYRRTAGLVGTGKIGMNTARILLGFGMNVLAYDPLPNEECKKMGVVYCDLERIYAESDVISLHVPLMPETHHIICPESIAKMKYGVMLINTSRGGLIDTPAVIQALKSGKIGYLGLDVYEEEGDVYFEDFSDKILQDDVLARLMTFHNVVMTGHQAFFTENAMKNISETTVANATAFAMGKIPEENLVHYSKDVRQT